MVFDPSSGAALTIYECDECDAIGATVDAVIGAPFDIDSPCFERGEHGTLKAVLVFRGDGR